MSPVKPLAESSNTPAIPVAIACLGCRSRHLKCDAGIPVCQRCRENGRECLYIKSRRGWKTSSSKESQVPQSGQIGARPAKRTLNVEPDHDEFEFSSPSNSSISPHNGGVSSNSPLEGTEVVDSPLSLIDLFYQYFHNAHPVMVPQKYYGTLLYTQFKPEMQTVASELIAPVLHYIGSFYLKTASRELYQIAAEKAVFGAQLPPGPDRIFHFVVPESPLSVTVLLLYSIATHGDGDLVLSKVLKDKAVEMAVRCNMADEYALDAFLKTACYSDDLGFLAVLKESFRRTYWMLYVVDAWYSAIYRIPTFALEKIKPTLYLPCEDDQYNGGEIPLGSTMEDYDSRIFAESSQVFSSFTYLVDAIRIMSSVVAYSLSGIRDRNAADLYDTNASIWLLHLPETKAQLMKPRSTISESNANSGTRVVDELMVLAHVAIHIGLIVVHRPLSKLGMLQMGFRDNEANCVPPESLLLALRDGVSSGQPAKQEWESVLDIHTRKCIDSADQLSSVIKRSPGTLIRRSPLFTCSMNLPLIVQLACCVWVFSSNSISSDREYFRHQVRLGVSALKAISQVWSIAGHILEQIKSAARIVFEQQHSIDGYLRDYSSGGKKQRVDAFPGTAGPVFNGSLNFMASHQSGVSMHVPSLAAVAFGPDASYSQNFDQSFVPHGESSVSSIISDSYSVASSIARSSPGDAGESVVQQSFVERMPLPQEARIYLSDTDRSLLAQMSSLPQPLISEDELMQMITGSDLTNDCFWTSIHNDLPSL